MPEYSRFRAPSPVGRSETKEGPPPGRGPLKICSNMPARDEALGLRARRTGPWARALRAGTGSGRRSVSAAVAARPAAAGSGMAPWPGLTTRPCLARGRRLAVVRARPAASRLAPPVLRLRSAARLRPGPGLEVGQSHNAPWRGAVGVASHLAPRWPLARGLGLRPGGKGGRGYPLAGGNLLGPLARGQHRLLQVTQGPAAAAAEVSVVRPLAEVLGKRGLIIDFYVAVTEDALDPHIRSPSNADVGWPGSPTVHPRPGPAPARTGGPGPGSEPLPPPPGPRPPSPPG